MIPDSTLPTLRQTCRTLQIIVLALATGVCVFAVVAIVQAQGKLTWNVPPTRMEDLVFLLMGVTTLVGSFVAPALMPATPADPNLPKAGDPQGDRALQAANAVQTRTIVGCALLEGGAFANLMAVFMHGYGPSLILAGLLMSMIVLRFPTWSRYLERIEAGMRRLSESS